MFWPKMETGARLVEVTPDDIGGEVHIWAVIDEKEYRGIVYEGMLYTQLREESTGLTVTAVSEMSQIEAKHSREPHTVKFIEDWDAGDEFLWDTYLKGFRLFVHHFSNGEKKIIMAQNTVIGEARPYNGPCEQTQIKAQNERGMF
ncbi:MAG: hypothetical protein LBV27_01400 [Oscillospiraceae bacterium]|nr:hypothetical protein [Oscillospiraceae bacterium]